MLMTRLREAFEMPARIKTIALSEMGNLDHFEMGWPSDSVRRHTSAMKAVVQMTSTRNSSHQVLNSLWELLDVLVWFDELSFDEFSAGSQRVQRKHDLRVARRTCCRSELIEALYYAQVLAGDCCMAVVVAQPCSLWAQNCS